MESLKCPATLVAEDGREVTQEVLVDPSTTFAVIPAPILESLGVKTWRELERRSSGTARMGQVEVIVQASAAYITCIFGDDDEQARLGSHSLASLLLQIDPATNMLVSKEFQEIRHF